MAVLIDCFVVIGVAVAKGKLSPVRVYALRAERAVFSAGFASVVTSLALRGELVRIREHALWARTIVDALVVVENVSDLAKAALLRIVALRTMRNQVGAQLAEGHAVNCDSNKFNRANCDARDVLEDVEVGITFRAVGLAAAADAEGYFLRAELAFSDVSLCGSHICVVSVWATCFVQTDFIVEVVVFGAVVALVAVPAVAAITHFWRIYALYARCVVFPKVILVLTQLALQIVHEVPLAFQTMGYNAILYAKVTGSRRYVLVVKIRALGIAGVIQKEVRLIAPQAMVLICTVQAFLVERRIQGQIAEFARILHTKLSKRVIGAMSDAMLLLIGYGNQEGRRSRVALRAVVIVLAYRTVR